MISLILSNFLFCTLSALILLPFLYFPQLLTHKNGRYFFLIFILIIVKFLIPFEFPFTRTLESTHVLPFVKKLTRVSFFHNITVGSIFLGIWGLVALIKIVHLIYQHYKLTALFSLIPQNPKVEITQILSRLCTELKINKSPKVLCLEINSAPFITGVLQPVIVIPKIPLSDQELYFILKHELEHLKHHHLSYKLFLEVVSILYWWNPLVWIVNYLVTCSLEVRTDSYVISNLTYDDKLIYLESLISISKKGSSLNISPVLSFSMKKNSIIQRARALIHHNQFKPYSPMVFIFPLISSLLILSFSFLFTFEASSVNPEHAKDTFTITEKNSYFICQNDNAYDLYVDNEFQGSFSYIPRDLSNIKIVHN